MYIDLIIIGLLLVVSCLMYKRFQFFIFTFAIIDLVLKVLYFLKSNISLGSFSTFINSYLPNGFEGLIDKYTTGGINIALSWVYIVIFIIFIFYCIKVLIKKKRI